MERHAVVGGHCVARSGRQSGRPALGSSLRYRRRQPLSRYVIMAANASRSFCVSHYCLALAELLGPGGRKPRSLQRRLQQVRVSGGRMNVNRCGVIPAQILLRRRPSDASSAGLE